MEGWRQLEKDYPEEMARCKGFLRRWPTNTRITNGRAKRLKGRLKDYLQYDVTYSHRVRYQVDGKRRTVDVVYAGPHP